MKVCKAKWLQYHVPYLELQDLLMDQQLGLVQATPCSNTQVGFMIQATPCSNTQVGFMAMKSDESR